MPPSDPTFYPRWYERLWCWLLASHDLWQARREIVNDSSLSIPEKVRQLKVHK